ncbi:MAG TPA: FIST N-terminal domain-containing protein [Polyangiaceae bacterium]|nr:FIST N-terminal domain-containing protein [Polyangiaceae bacterium]
MPALPKLVLSYLTVNHDQAQFLSGLREALGPDVPVVGCSGQGVMGRGAVHEDGYAASLMALGGAGLEVAVARADDVHVDSRAKGVTIGQTLREQHTRPPKICLLHYDPLCGVDLDVLLSGVGPQIEAPIMGGAAAHFFNVAMTTTYQYFGQEVFSKGAVAVSLAGDFSAEMAFSTSCAPVGHQLTVTKVEGNQILEFDGRSALDVWREITGSSGALDVMASSSVAIGVPVAGVEGGHLIRAAFVFDEKSRGMLLSAAVPEGTTVTLYHRTVDDTLSGAARTADELAERLAGKQLRAVLGFECGGRTRPFLGMAATNEENRALQAKVGPSAEWAGVICWGELFPVGGKPGFHNYAFPLLAIAE